MTAPAPTPTDSAPAARRVSPTRVVLLIVVLAMAGIWVYILYLAFGPGRQPPIDRLTDPTFAPAAQARCSQALDEVALLPDATEAPNADARADVIEAANSIFDGMLTDLAALAPDGEEGDMVTAWVTDWHTYLDDRQAYADALRQDPDARFLVSAKDNDQITEYIDGFAADNQMPACGTPLDV